MAAIVRIKKGLDIKLLGDATKETRDFKSEYYSIQPTEFRTINPRLLVAEGDKVKVGTPLFQDKKNEKILITSPVSGQITEIRRGEKRRLEHIIIKNDFESNSLDFGKTEIDKLERAEVIEKLLISGLWPYIKQRPYGVIANPADAPDAIFISGFDSAPLAPDMKFVMSHYEIETFQAGIDILKKLTPGQIHLNVNPDLGIADMFLKTQNIQINQFSGPHPSGNIGVQIHHIRPIIKGDMIWYLSPQDIIMIGKFFLTGKINLERIFAICGSELKSTFYIRSIVGAQISSLLEDNLNEENVRVISGNVLSGTKISKNSFLSFYNQMITVIPEGDYFEFLGWADPGIKKFSFSKSFPSSLFKNKKWRLDTNMHGEERAFVVSGQYEKVFPFEIMPVFLLKAIITKDLELMEELGIYEVAEEDFALCEVICTSKIESQQIVRDGIDMMIKELS